MMTEGLIVIVKVAVVMDEKWSYKNRILSTSCSGNGYLLVARYRHVRFTKVQSFINIQNGVACAAYVFLI